MHRHLCDILAALAKPIPSLGWADAVVRDFGILPIYAGIFAAPATVSMSQVHFTFALAILETDGQSSTAAINSELVQHMAAATRCMCESNRKYSF